MAGLWLLAADVTDVPASIPTGDRAVAILFGIAAVITALASPLVAYAVGRRKTAEDELPRLREDVRNLARDNEDQRHDILALSRYVFALEQLASAKGATKDELPARPVLRITRQHRREAEES